MSKKAKPIKAEQYKDEEEIIEEEVFEDDYYEDENESVEEIVEESPKTFKVKEEKQQDEDDYEEASSTFRRVNSSKFMKIFNVFFVIIMIIMLIICVDVIFVTKYNAKPLFAIKTKTYKDGGTTEYYGLGYKVIKYNEEFGRRDTQIGFWNLKYSTEPLTIEDIDLAIEFQNKPQETANKYYKKYVMIFSTIKEIDKEDNEVTLEYTDPDGKYTLEIECDMASFRDSLEKYKVNDQVPMKGTIYKFSVREEDDPNSVSLSNCFID